MATVNFDDVLLRVGDFGRYQKYVYGLICALGIHSGLISLSPVFTSYIPNHRCRLPGWDGDTYHIQNENHSAAINATIPVVYDNNSLTAGWNQCLMYTNNGTLMTCTEWVYDTSIFTDTIVSEFNLVCERQLYRSHMRMIYMAGHMGGSLIYGVTSDKIGRRYSMLISLTLCILSGALMVASPNVVLVMALYFPVGMGIGTFLVAFGLGLEFVGKSKRFHAGMIVNYMYAIGLMIEALFSYIVRDWKHLQLLVFLPGIVFVSYFWLLPESPRWLINRSRHAEVRAIVERIAKDNKTEVDETLLRNLTKDQSPTTVKIWELFRQKSLAIISIIVMFNWITCALLYYGISLNSADLVGSIHLNIFFSGLMEIVATFLSHVLVNRIGRKWVFVIFILFGGIACLSTIFTLIYLSTAHQWLTVVLAMLGKLGVTSAFTIVYIHTAEIFPTVIRTSSLGVASMVGRIGSIISPYIADLSLVIGGNIGRALPLMIFGVVAVMSGLASLYLPETRNKPLPETFDDCKKTSQDPYIVVTSGEQVQLVDKRLI